MRKKAKIVKQLLQELADENRLLILCALLEKPLTLDELAVLVPELDKQNLNIHLVLLNTQNIININQIEDETIYSISDQRVINLIETLKINYCTETL